MKTKCYCIYCSKHPLYKKLLGGHPYSIPVNAYSPGDYIGREYTAGVQVDCLVPKGQVFDELGINPEDVKDEFEITAYGDGLSITGYIEKPNEYTTVEVWATCGNEDYLGDK